MADSIIKKDRKTEEKSSASYSHLFNNAAIIKNGGVVSIILRGLENIPVGVVTTIFTLPLEYRPLSADRYFDLMIPNTSGDAGLYRVTIYTNVDVNVYVYHVASSDQIHNAYDTLTFTI